MKTKKMSVFSANKALASEPLNENTTNLTNQTTPARNDSDEEIEIKSSIFAKGLKATKKAAIKLTPGGAANHLDTYVNVLQQQKSRINSLQNKYKTFAPNKSSEVKTVQSDEYGNDDLTMENDESVSDVHVERPFGLFNNTPQKVNIVNSSNKTTSINQTNEVNSISNDCYNKFSTPAKLTTKADIENKLIHTNSTQKKLPNCAKDITQESSPDLVDKPNVNSKGRKRKVSGSEDPVAGTAAKRRNIGTRLKSPLTPGSEDSNSVMMEVSWRPTSVSSIYM
jgi:hypothetical protein